MSLIVAHHEVRVSSMKCAGCLGVIRGHKLGQVYTGVMFLMCCSLCHFI